MSELDAVLFDLYDTLVRADWAGQEWMLADRLEVTPDAVAAAYEDLRHQRDGGAFADAASVLAAVVEHCGVEPDSSLIADLAVWEAEMMAEGIVLYEDSLPTLRRLRAEGVRTAIVSNCSPSTRPVVDRLGLEEEAEAVLLSCEVRAAKPNPAIYAAALEALQVRSERSMFVDDRTEYLDGAARLGMRTAQIVRDRAQPEPSGVHPRIDDLHELLQLMA